MEDFKESKSLIVDHLERQDQFLDECTAFFKLADNYFKRMNIDIQIQIDEESNTSENETLIDHQTESNLDEENVNENHERISIGYR